MFGHEVRLFVYLEFGERSVGGILSRMGEVKTKENRGNTYVGDARAGAREELGSRDCARDAKHATTGIPRLGARGRGHIMRVEESSCSRSAGRSQPRGEAETLLGGVRGAYT